jgi:hypothetical protein
VLDEYTLNSNDTYQVPAGTSVATGATSEAIETSPFSDLSYAYAIGVSLDGTSTLISPYSIGGNGALTAAATTTLNGTVSVLPLTLGTFTNPPLLYTLTTASGDFTSVEFFPINADGSLGATPSGGPLSITAEPEVFLHYSGVTPILY